MIKYTADLMLNSSVFNVVQYKSVLAAAENGWPGAVCAWIGVKNKTLRNVDYIQAVREDFEDSIVETTDLAENNCGKAVLLAIRDRQYHLLRYLPRIQTLYSFNSAFPDGHVSFDFFQRLTNFPETENLFNNKLGDYLETIAEALLVRMRYPDVQRLQREANAAKDIKSINFINQILN